MSETELVQGVIQGIVQKAADKWQVQVDTGQQNPRGLWTKDAELVDSLSVKIGQAGAFVCGISEWQKDGKPIRSLWINSLSDGQNPASSVSTPAAAPQEAASGPKQEFAPVKTATEGMSKEEWARKDSAIHKMACIKTAADALKHTVPSDPTAEDLTKFLARCSTLSLAWHRSVLNERDDPTGESVPF